MGGYIYYSWLLDAAGGYLKMKEVLNDNFYSFLTYLEYNAKRNQALEIIRDIK